jgi:TonB-linked SusC/RagA family outer membrane protein
LIFILHLKKSILTDIPMRKTITQFCSLLIALLSVFYVQAQNITGTVSDKTGEGVPGATVSIKERPGKGAISDLAGTYVLENVKPGKITLVFAFIGYTTKEVPAEVVAGTNQTINVILEESISELDEAVVVGYGVQRRREVTGSIVKLSGAELNDMPAPSFEATIQGKAPGVQIVTGGGMAGSGSVVRVRGISSIGAGGDPLYIVDGVQLNQDYFAGRSIRNPDAGGMNQNPLAFLNPDDIESVEILKDAGATAIYGSRGANGVILITTKRGKGLKAGQLRFNFSTTQGISMPTKRPTPLSGPEWLQLYEEAWVNDGNVGVPTGLPGGLTWEEAQQNNTNWVDEVIRTGYKQFYDFNVQKSGNKYNFYVGLSYDANQSYLKGDQYDRLSGRFNGDYKFSDKFDMSISTSLTRAVYDRIDNGPAGGLGAAMGTALPIYPIYHDKDVYQDDPDNPGDSIIQFRKGDYWYRAGASNNPAGMIAQKEWRNTELRSLNNVRLNYTPIKNLTFSSSTSFDYSNFVEDIFEPAGIGTIIGPNDDLGTGISKRWPRTSRNFNTFLTATYNYEWREHHDFTFLVGTEYQEARSNTRQIKVYNDAGEVVNVTNEVFQTTAPFYADDNLVELNPFDSIVPEATSKFASAFTRVNYNYKGKYLLQAVLRTDGSSRFGPSNRYGFFPSVSGGWILTNEEFMRNNRYINFLKLKSSIGYIGNANLGANEFFARYGTGGRYDNQPITYPLNAPNPDLKWESTEIFDAGIEFGLFNDRITGELAYYRKNTSDVLMTVALPAYNGFGSYYDNVGGVLNYGVEAKISTVNISTNNFSWKTDFNIAFNRNRITSLGGYSEDAVGGGTNDTRIVEGASVGTFYMVPVAYINSETGLPVYRTPEGGTTTTYSQDLRVAVGKGIPDAIGGFNNTFTYKNWSLSTLFVYSIGADVYDHSGKYQQTAWAAFGNYWNYTDQVFDRWQKPGDEARLPRLTLDPKNQYPGLAEDFWNTSLWVQDASYLRLRNVTLNYNLNRNFVKRLKMQNISIAFIATNLLTFTKYPGLDPEVARDFTDITDRNLSVNTTYLTPPQEKTFSVRINASF